MEKSNVIALGCFPFNKKFRNGDNCCRNFQGNFPENQKIAEFPKSNHSNENSGNSGKKFPKVSVYRARFSSFPEIFENAVPFVAGDFRKFKPEFIIERTASNVRHRRPGLESGPLDPDVTAHQPLGLALSI